MCVCVRACVRACVRVCVCAYVLCVCMYTCVLFIMYLLSSVAKEQVCNIGIVVVQSDPHTIAVAIQPQGITQEQYSVQE